MTMESGSRASQFILKPNKVEIAVDKPFKDAAGFRARFTGYSGTALKTTVTSLDFQIPAERWINGVQLIVSNHVLGDKVDFKIVDVSGLYSPAGTVLDDFATNWFMDPGTSNQGICRTEFPARLYAGLWMRLAYTSVGTVNDVTVLMNAMLHIKV